MKFAIAWPVVAAMSFAAPAFSQQVEVLFSENFDSPVGFSDPDLLSLSFLPVNDLFGTAFQNTFTVETVQVANSPLYSDPTGTGGAFALGMLSDAEDDQLAAVFDVTTFGFLNLQMDVSSLDLDCCSGPFNPDGVAPVFEFRLFDAPQGVFDVFVPTGALLDSGMITGSASARMVFDWTQHVVSLDASGSTDGNVALVIDLIEGGYAAFDNLIIASSDDRGVVGNPLPDESTGSGNSGGGALHWWLALLVPALAGIKRRRMSAAKRGVDC